jgi:exopolysaccharide biosynthesis polyprenyl glycosylphosphotransferase
VTAKGIVNAENISLSTMPAGSISQTTMVLVPEVASKGTKIWLSSSVRRALTILTMITMDTLALLVGLALAGYLVDGESQVGEVIRFAPILLPIWLAVFVAWDLYARVQSRRNPGTLLGAILSGMGLLAIGSIMYTQGVFSLEEILFGTLFIVLLEGGLLLFYKRGSGFISRWGLGLIPTLIIGEGQERAGVRKAMERNPGAYACVGELNTSVRAVDLPLLREALDRTGARSVILAAGTERLPRVQFQELLRSMRLRSVKVTLAAGANALTSGKPMIFQEDIGIPLLEVSSPQLDSTQWALKRMLDVASSLAGLIIISPLLLGVAILIKLTSPGPIFFRQKRVGADEKVFTCYKFRSMYEDAERRQAELEAQNEAGDVIFKIEHDPRITPVGRFMRRMSIDELPQLINVLMGEMSLVGPRPLPLRDFERMGELHKKRLATVPGITGYWQISGRSDVSFEGMWRLDLYYIENWSLSLDIKILLKTIKVVLRRDGAC